MDAESVKAWNFASPDWCCPHASNELRPGGAFSYRMEARDSSMGFDFAGHYLEVQPPERLRFAMGAEREVLVQFRTDGDMTEVLQTFTPEPSHSLEHQRAGWQAIMDNFKRHAETGA